MPGAVVVGAVGLYVALVPVLPAVPGMGLFNGQRVLEVAVLAVASFALLFHSGRAQALEAFLALPFVARWGLALILGLGSLSAALAPHPGAAFLEVGHLTLLVVLTLQVAGLFARGGPETRRTLVAAVAVGAGLYATGFAVGYVVCVAQGFPVWPHSFTGFAHIRFFNQYQVWTLPLLVLPAALLPIRSVGVRGALLVLPALWYALLVASNGRGATLALFGALVVVPLLFRGRAFPWLKLQLTALAGGAVLYVLLFVVLADNTSVFERDLTADSGRLALWRMAAQMTVHHPFLGEGPMQFARYVNDDAAHPHNLVLQWTAEWGIPATLVFFGLLGWGFVQWVRRGNDRAVSQPDAQRDLVFVALTASLMAAAAYSLVDGLLVMPLGQLLTAVILGWTLAEHRGVGRPVRPDRRASRVLLAVVAVAWMVLLHGIAPTVGDLEARQAAFIDATREEIEHPLLLHPRFWQQGFIAERPSPDVAHP